MRAARGIYLGAAFVVAGLLLTAFLGAVAFVAVAFGAYLVDTATRW